jgi:hypothetical protein
MLPHHGAERNFNTDLISYASVAKPFLTVDRKDYLAFKRPPRKARTAIGRRLIAVTEDRLLAEVSGYPTPPGAMQHATVNRSRRPLERI